MGFAVFDYAGFAALGAKPVGLLNAFGFYDQLVGFYHHMAAIGFVRPAHSGIMIVEDRIDTLVPAMQSYQPHRTIFAMQASDL